MRVFRSGHEELVHDIKYDFYGKHLATASSDQHIKVFELEAATSTWVLNDSWKAHDSLIVKISWANPEFSNFKLLASCSYDRTVKIWQENPDELHGSGRRWTKLATLAVESFGPIYDVTFAPPHLGLKLGCVGSDGIVRIYQSIEPSDLTQWSLTAEIPILSLQLPAKSLQSSFSIEWCPAKFASRELLIVIALDQGFIYEASSGQQTADTGSITDASSVGGPQRDGALLKLSSEEPRGGALADDGLHSEPSAAGGGAKYRKICSLLEHNGLIRSVSWAPSMGRSYHLIATGCKDGSIRIFKGTEEKDGRFKVSMVAKLDDHHQEVWRVSWNSTGTILSSAGDDGKVRLWKKSYMDEWQCMSEINSSNRLENRAQGDHADDS